MAASVSKKTTSFEIQPIAYNESSGLKNAQATEPQCAVGAHVAFCDNVAQSNLNTHPPRASSMTQPTSWKQSPWLRLAVTALALAALVWLLRDVDPAQLQVALGRVPAWVWLVSVLGMVCSHVLRGGRMRAEWRHRLDMDWRSAWALVVRHSAWVVLSPMRGGEGIYLWALNQHGGIGLKEAGISLLKLRLQDMAVLGVFALATWLPLSLPLRWGLAAFALLASVWLVPSVWRWLVRRSQAQALAPSAQAPQAGALAFESWFYALSNWAVKLVAIGLPLWFLAGASAPAAWSGALGGRVGSGHADTAPSGLGPL